MTAPAPPSQTDAYAPPQPGARCANCDAALVGEYCAACGQKAADLDPTVRELLREGWAELTSVDGKLLRTLHALVLKPGLLTAEYIAGRRTRYVSPLKLYLWLSVLYFFVSALVPDRQPAVRYSVWSKEERAQRARTRDSVVALAVPERRAALRDSLERATVRDSLAALDAAVDSLESAAAAIESDSARSAVGRVLGAGLRRAAARQEEFQRTLEAWVPRTIFALVPIFALLLRVVYRSRRLRYPRHLAFAFHLHAFIFAVLLVVEALGAAGSGLAVDIAGAVVLAIGIPAYGVVAMQRVYGGRMRATIARAALLAAMYLPLFALAMGLAAVLALLTFSPARLPSPPAAP